MLFGYLGIWIALTQGGLIRPIMRYFSPDQVIRLATLVLAAALLMLLVPTESWQIFLVIPFVSICQGLTTPNITATVSNLADAKIQGEILGINQSVNSFAQLLPPLIGGILVGFDIRMPLLVSASFMFFAWLVFTLSVRSKKRAQA
jgi:DHA1 family tetracycline resistance protein-like MFS transporter